jgi:hypothetical protein
MLTVHADRTCRLYMLTVHADCISLTSPTGQWRQDPRLPDLGLRGVFDAQQLPPPPAEAGGTSSRKQRAAGMSVVGEDAYRRWRYQLGVAEGDSEIPSGGEGMSKQQRLASGCVQHRVCHVMTVCQCTYTHHTSADKLREGYCVHPDPANSKQKPLVSLMTEQAAHDMSQWCHESTVSLLLLRQVRWPPWSVTWTPCQASATPRAATLGKSATATHTTGASSGGG